MALRRMAACAVVAVCGLWLGAATAAEIVRVDLVNGQVVQGRLVGNTARELVLELPGGTRTVNVLRAEIRRFSVVAVDAKPQPAARAPRLPPAERTGTLRLSGANSMGAQLLPALLTDYGLEAGLTGVQEEVTTDPALRLFQLQGAESSRRLRVQVLSRGSSVAFTDLAGGQADIGMSTRRATEAEARTLQLAGAASLLRADNERVIGLSGVVAVVHRDNPMRAMSVSQLRDLLSGAVTRWPVVGGNGLPVTVYALDNRSGEYDAVQERILGAGTRLAPQAKLFESHEDLADAVAADPSAIGFVGAAYVRNTQGLRLEQDCGLGGDPNPFNFKTEEYPLSRRLYLYGAARISPVARDLLAYAASSRAEGVVATSGFVNLDPLLATVEQSQAQLAAIGQFLPEDMRAIAAAQVAALREALRDARRLSVTFRFEGGRVDMDPRAEADLERLAQWVRRAGAAESSLILVGHASLDGQFATNVELSRARAQSVAARLRQMGIPVSRIEAGGPVNQVVCSRNATESDMNRRVEVWVR